jgi:4-hydroxy-4-methyl-2-oxoglutarate aldolase
LFYGAGERPPPAADYIDQVPSSDVIVIANGGRMHCTVWGDLLTLVARQRGIQGVVIDGCCRDATAIMDGDFPVFARAAYMKSGKNRVRLVARAVTVMIGGQAVEPGDFVRGDDSGAIVVPAAVVDRVVDLCQQIAAMEAKVEADVRSGIPLAEARQRQGYNQFALARTREAAR